MSRRLCGLGDERADKPACQKKEQDEREDVKRLRAAAELQRRIRVI